MLAVKRRERIEELLSIQTSVSVRELIAYLQVSAATVRRDLSLMEKEGLILRVHGGVKRKEKGERVSELAELPIKRKLDLHAAEKLNIARSAASLVQDGDCIFIDSGSTPAYLYDFLRHKNVWIVTNNLMLLHKIKETDHAKVILGAGEYNATHQLMEGHLMLDVINQFNFHSAFIGVSGFDGKTHSLTCTTLQASSIKKHAMRQSAHAYVMADSSKRKEKGIITFAKSEEIDAILTSPFEEECDIHNLIIC